MALDWFVIAQEHGFTTPKAMLDKLYIEDGYTIQDLADHLGCSTWAIRYAMDRFEVPVRTQGGTRSSRRTIAPEKIQELLNKLKEDAK